VNVVTGETDLGRLLAGLDPVLHDGEYFFVTRADREVPAGADPVMTFDEDEGRTLILPRGQAEAAGLAGEFSCAWITLRIHSSLAAVGMLAAITRALTDAGISCNPVAGYFHDHLFVQHDRAQDAVTVLRELAAGRAATSMAKECR
jgi:uncharacterized protein